MSATKRTARRTTGRRRTPARRTTSRTTTRRRTPKLTTTLGAALGALVATFVLELGWGARIGIIVAVLLVGVAYLLWSHRAEVAAGAEQDPPPAPPAAGSPASPATPEQP